MTNPIDYAALEVLRAAWEHTEIYDIANGFMRESAYNQALRNEAPALIAAAKERDELAKCGHPSTLDILRATGRELGERTAELARVRVMLDDAVENEDRILEEMEMRRDEFAEYRIQASTELARVQAMLDEAREVVRPFADIVGPFRAATETGRYHIPDEYFCRASDFLVKIEKEPAAIARAVLTEGSDWDSLRGTAPDATGETSSEAFVRKMRDEWPG